MSIQSNIYKRRFGATSFSSQYIYTHLYISGYDYISVYDWFFKYMNEYVGLTLNILDYICI